MERLFVNKDKELIVEGLIKNKVILCNSDTVPALICNIKDDQSIEKIIKIKKRNEEKRFAIMCSNLEMAKEYVDLQNEDLEVLLEIFPGYFTIISNLKEKKLNSYLFKDNKVGIRIPKSEFLIDIINSIKMPIVATSANISNNEVAKNLELVESKIKANVDLIINNKEDLINKSSTILDISQKPWKILREGSGLINDKIIKYL